MKSKRPLCLMFAMLYLANALDIQQKYICEGDTKKLTCISEFCRNIRIYVLDGNYGRLDENICRDDNIETTDCKTGKEKIESECHCETSCELTATNEFFNKDPCKDTYKYVSVTYACVAMSKHECRVNDPAPCFEPTTAIEQTTSIYESTSIFPSDGKVSIDSTANIFTNSTSDDYTSSHTLEHSSSKESGLNNSLTTKTNTLESGMLSALEWAGVGIGISFFIIATIVGWLIVIRRKRKNTEKFHSKNIKNNKSISNDELINNERYPPRTPPLTSGSNFNQRESEDDYVDVLNSSEMMGCYDSSRSTDNDRSRQAAIFSNECIYSQPKKKKRIYENARAEQDNCTCNVSTLAQAFPIYTEPIKKKRTYENPRAVQDNGISSASATVAETEAQVFTLGDECLHSYSQPNMNQALEYEYTLPLTEQNTSVYTVAANVTKTEDNLYNVLFKNS